MVFDHLHTRSTPSGGFYSIALVPIANRSVQNNSVIVVNGDLNSSRLHLGIPLESIFNLLLDVLWLRMRPDVDAVDHTMHARQLEVVPVSGTEWRLG